VCESQSKETSVFRIIRRSPWIAVGAFGAWLLDAEQGPKRRAQVTDQAKRLANSLTGASGQTSFPSAPADLSETSPSFEMTAESLEPSGQNAPEKDAPSGRTSVGAAVQR
jgi:hypothetical protein